MKLESSESSTTVEEKNTTITTVQYEVSNSMNTKVKKQTETQITKNTTIAQYASTTNKKYNK